MNTMYQFNYSEFTDRNWAYINRDLQRIIKRTRIFFAGCGLGSLIAETSARLGFSNFLLADGDIVEVSNLNRQIFNKTHIGINKATATASILRKINSKSNIEVYRNHIKSEDIPHLARKSDFIINTVDFGKVYSDLVKIVQSKNKYVLLPFSVGFGGFVFVFNKDTPSLDEILGDGTIKNDTDFYQTLLKRIPHIELPEYISVNLNMIFSEVTKKKNIPQICIGAEITSALVVTTIVKILSNHKIPLAPRFSHVDLLETNHNVF